MNAIDTNVWISGLLNPSGPPGRVLAAAFKGDFEVAFTASTLDELRSVAQRRRLVDRFGLQPGEVLRLSNLLLHRGRMLPPDLPVLSISRDPRDDMFIAAAVAGDADYLVTRDDDLKRDPAVAAYF